MPTEISPWINRLREHRVAVVAATALLVLTVALAWVAWRWIVAEDRMAMLEKRAEAGFLQAPSTSRIVRPKTSCSMRVQSRPSCCRIVACRSL